MIRSRIAMGFLWGLLALLLHVVPGAVNPAHAQGTRKDDIVFNSRGIPLAGATVRVCAMPASGQPCTPLALIYSDAALTQAVANPTTSDGLGNYFFYAAPGKYEIEISGPGITTKQIPNVILPNDPASPTFTGAVSAFSLNLTGNLSVTGNTTVIGSLASGTLNLANQGTPPGSAGAGTVNLYTKTTDKRVYYKDETGAEIGPLGPGSGAQTNVSNTFTAPQNFNADLQIKGPNPYMDVRAYGVRALAQNATPAVAGITANITATQTTATVSTSSCASQASSTCFVNGDGVVIFGAGPTQAMSTPGAPTVAPSLARVMTGTGDVTPGLTGATTYNYKIIACDQAGGCTAASTAGTTATGAAALGSQSVSITSATRATNVNTYVTSSAHGLTVGAMVIITGMSDNSFNGWYQVSGSADNTHFTVVQGNLVANGASTSATGGTVFWFNCNHISWTAVPGAFRYYVYTDRAVPGTFALLGVSQANFGSSSGGTVTDMTLYLDDFGATMMNGFTAFPPYIQTTAPSVATSDNLVTKIVSGAGTTTLTLAAAAGTTVSGATILYTDSPNIVTAAIAAGGNPLYFPNGTGFLINSVLDLSGVSAVAMVGGGTLNDTFISGNNAKWDGQAMQNSGSAGQFALQTTTSISCNVSPCLAFNGSYLGHLSIASKGNGQTLVSANGAGFAGTLPAYEYLYFGQNANDQMNIQLLMRSDGGGDGTGARIKGVNFNSTQTALGVTATPVFYCDGCYQHVVDSQYVSGRGMLFRPVPAGMRVTYNYFYDQAGTSPAITVTGNLTGGGNTGAAITLNQLQPDTLISPVLTVLTSAGTVSLSASFGSVGPTSGPPQSTGNPMFALTGSTNGQNTAAISGANFTDNNVQVVGTGAIGSIIQPVAPASAIVSAGGSVPLGMHTYGITVFDALGREGPIGPLLSVTATSGNQTVTVTPPAAPAGAVQWRAYRDGQMAHPSFPLSFTQTLVDTVGFTDGAPNTGTSFSSGITSSGLETQSLNLTGGGFKNTVSGTFTANRTQTLPDLTGVVPVTGYINSAYDNATRANGAIGANWTVTTGGINVASNNFQGTAATNAAFWNVNPFATDEFAEATVTALNAGTDFIGPSVRVSAGGNWYSCVESNASLIFQRSVSGTTANLVTQSITGAVGDVLRIEVQGSTVKCYQNGALLITQADSNLTSGSPGMEFFGTVATLKNWSGGNLHPLAHLDAEQDFTKTQHFTQGLAFGTETVSSSPRGIQSAFLPGALTATWTGSTWTLDKAVSVTRVQIQAKTAPAGCTTNASVRLTDGTSPVNLTISAAANDSGPITQNYAAGASLTIAVQTAAAGCTTSPADANVVVQYRMQ